MNEVLAPKRVLTTTIFLRTASGMELLPVRSAHPIPRELQKQAVACLSDLVVNAPVRMGDVLVKDLLNTGVSIIAAKSVIN